MWCKLWKVDSLAEGIKKDPPLLLYMLGFSHHCGDGMLRDINYAVVDGIHLGVIHKDLEKSISESFSNLKKRSSFKGKKTTFCKDMLHRRKDIVNVLKSRVDGLHRICFSNVKGLKKIWLKSSI